MWLTSISIRRPIFLIMFVLALIVVGYQSRSRMPAEMMPNITLPYVTISTIYPGAGPNEIETLVSEPIEKAVSSIGRLKNVTSTSQDGVSIVALEFELGTDVDAAAADVRDKVSAVKRSLPRDIEEPSILKVDFGSMPIMTIGLTGPLSAKEMRILADDIIADKFAKIGGVAGVYVRGGAERELSVAVDKDRLQAYGISIDEVTTAIKAANLNLPAGSIKEGPRDYSVRTVGEFKTVEDLAQVRLPVGGDGPEAGQVIRLGDVARVTDTIKEPDTYTRLNGKSTVVIDIQKQSDANTVETAKGVKEELDALEKQLPPGVKPIIARDDSIFVEDSLHDVNKSLTEGIILVVIIVFLFLRTARATFIVAIAIPTSLMATYTPIHTFGFTQNFMTLLALSLVVGILVDDSIVVLENIERHLRKRENPVDASINGRAEIGGAAVAITMVDIVVFVPVAFMGGIVGQFFRQFGVTVAVATFFSLLMSFTLTPMLASRWMRAQAEVDRGLAELRRRLAGPRPGLYDRFNGIVTGAFGASERSLKAIERRYHLLLEWALDNRFMTVVIGSATLLVVMSLFLPLPKAGDPGFAKSIIPRAVVVTIVVLASLLSMWRSKSKRVAAIFAAVMSFIALTIYLPLGFEFQPAIDDGEFSVSIRTAPGSSLEATDTVVRRVEALLRQIPELKDGYYISTVGTASAGGMGAGDTGPQYALIRAKCVDKTMRKRSVWDIAGWVSRRTPLIPGAEQIAITVGEGGGPGGGLSYEVQGQSMEDILRMSEIVAGVMEKTPGAIDVDISWKEGRPERRIVVDKERAAAFGLSVAQVALAARTAIDGDDSAKLRESGTEYPIMVRYAKSGRSASSDVGNLIVAHKDGAPVYLNDVAEVRYDFAPTKIDRKNRQRVVTVNANIAQGALLGNVQQAVNQGLASAPKVVGTTVEVGGTGQIMVESFQYMLQALALAVLFVYMLMGALFESFLTPLVIMFSLPQAMAGAFLALLLTGGSISIVSLIGIIMLMGLVSKNAILLVDFTNTLRRRGREKKEALLEAGPIRLRPILMTTFAMIGGMLPTALAVSRGAEIRAPMAVAVIGGLALSMLLTLIVIPVVYSAVDDIWHWILRVFWPAAYRRSLDKQKLWKEEASVAVAADDEGPSEY